MTSLVYICSVVTVFKLFSKVQISNILVWNHFWQDCGKLYLMLWSNYVATMPVSHMFRDESLLYLFDLSESVIKL